jgi:exonuclease SbcC
MIPVKIKLEGFLSYREPVELDFTGFDLACISGPNGAGKSSLLDAITWALFGQARKRDESVINTHPAVDAAEVTLDFAYEGNLYRVLRTNPRGKTSSVEFFIQSPQAKGKWKSLSERTLRETDRKIQDTLRMDFETFTNASFFLQGKADQFATARPGERKRILSSILGLEVWETYREATSKRRRALESDIRELDGRLKVIQNELNEGPQRRAHLAELEERLEEMVTERERRAQNLENVRRLRAALDEQKKALDRLKSQLEKAVQDRDSLRETLAKRREEKAEYAEIMDRSAAIEKAYAEWQEARDALEAMDELAEEFRQGEALRHAPLSAIQAESARLEQAKQTLLEQQAALEEALSEKPNLEAALKEARDALARAEGQLENRETLEAEIRQLQADQAEAKAENPRLREEMQELKARIEQLQAADGVNCPLCGQALSPDERQALIEGLTEKGKSLGDRFRENKRLLENFENQLQTLGGQLADLSSVENTLREAARRADHLESQLGDLEAQEKKWQETKAPKLATIATALETEDYAPEARARLQEIEVELEDLGYDLKAHEKLRQTEQAGRDAEADMRALDQARAALAPLAREISGLEAQAETRDAEVHNLSQDHDEAAAAFAAAAAEEPDVAQAEADLIDLREQENRLRLEVGEARQRVAVLKTLDQRKQALLEERDTINHRIANLKQLERAFGKDGIPALLIEQALPEIEENTNALLSRLTNGRMSFSFLTQREYKDTSREDLKETLDIIISDNMGERDYEMFSGGEAFRVNFSIRLALSRVLARRAGARLQTLVIDEGFGSQDAQGRQRLVEAINMVRDDFEKILVITHLESLKEAFPTRIEVEKTAAGSQLTVN